MSRILLCLFLLITMISHSLPAQQWKTYQIPPQFPPINLSLRAVGDTVFYNAEIGLYRSRDGGDHWEQIRNYQLTNIVQAFEVNRNNNKLYYSQGIDSSGFWELYSSTDLGNTWSKIGNLKAGVSAFIGDTIYGAYFGTELELARKAGSQPWTLVPNWPKDTAGTIYEVTAEGQHMWVAAAKGVYHSPDAGSTWELSLPLTEIIGPNGAFPPYLKALNGEVVLLNPFKKRLYYTKDQGASWQQIYWRSTRLYDSGKNLYTMDSTRTQLLRFNGGEPANWEVIPFNQPAPLQPNGVGEHQGTYWMGLGATGVLRKRSDSAIWSLANGELTSMQTGTPRFLDGHLFLDSGASYESFTPDQGITWRQNLDTETPNRTWQKGNYNYMLSYMGAPLLRCPRNDRFEWRPYGNLPGTVYQIAAAGDTLLSNKWGSVDNGLSWTAVPDFQGFTINPILSRQGKFYTVKGPALYRTDDVGLSWQPIYTFPHAVDETAGRFYIVHDTILLSYSALDRIYYSPDGGQTFDTLVTPQNPSTSGYRLLYSNGLLLLNLNLTTLYLSKDIGKTWMSVNLPAGYNVASIIGGDSWAYGDNTVFIPENYKLRLDEQRQVSGRVFLDSNSNGQKDGSEPALNNYIVRALQSEALSTTYGDGNFSMLLGPATDKLVVADVPPHYVSVPPQVIVPGGNFNTSPASFAIQPQGLVVDDAVNLVASSVFRAGYTTILYVQVKNAGTVMNSGQLKLVLNPVLSTVSTTPAADEQHGDTLVWYYTNLPPLQVRKFQLQVKTTITPPGTPILLSAEVITVADIDGTNNQVVLNEQVVSSYDPNDKTVSAVSLPIDQVSGEELVYTIRFQNLGNVATDFITVRDTLSESLDITSIRVLAASHFYDWKIESGHVLVFRFNPIHLSPAVTDSLRSQGFVQFSAKLLPGLQVGDEIANTAFIYFDFNPAVVTNTVITDIQVVATFEPARQAQLLGIFPNPANTQATLRLPEGPDGTGQIEIFAAAGRLIHSAAVQGNVYTLNLPAFPNGTYWCRWTLDSITYWGKMLVQH